MLLPVLDLPEVDPELVVPFEEPVESVLPDVEVEPLLELPLEVEPEEVDPELVVLPEEDVVSPEVGPPGVIVVPPA